MPKESSTLSYSWADRSEETATTDWRPAWTNQQSAYTLTLLPANASWMPPWHKGLAVEEPETWMPLAEWLLRPKPTDRCGRHGHRYDTRGICVWCDGEIGRTCKL